MNESYIIIRRYPYEEPYHTQLEFIVSNGVLLGAIDFYCNVSDIADMGRALKIFPSRIGDEYRYEYGSENPDDNDYRYFLMRAYTTNSVGDCAVQFIMNLNEAEPHEGRCQFSLRAEAATLNKLGNALEYFGQLKHLELHWDGNDATLYETHRDAS